MRFRNLKGLTGLPVDKIRHRFRNEDVLTVLPVSGGMTGRDAILIATSSKLAVVIADGRESSEQWVTYLSPWDSVSLPHESPASDDDDGVARLLIGVDSMTFEAALGGTRGTRAVADFVAIVEAQHGALAPSA